MNKIKELINKVARRILRQEIQDLNNQIQILQGQADRDKYCKTDILLSKSVVRELMRILPSANNTPQKNIFESLKQIKSELLSLIHVSVIDEVFGVLKLTFQMNSTGIQFSIYRRQKVLRYTMLGVDTELATGYWTFDGIKVVSDEDFDLIFTAINSQRNALLELN